MLVDYLSEFLIFFVDAMHLITVYFLYCFFFNNIYTLKNYAITRHGIVYRNEIACFSYSMLVDITRVVIGWTGFYQLLIFRVHSKCLLKYFLVQVSLCTSTAMCIMSEYTYFFESTGRLYPSRDV